MVEQAETHSNEKVAEALKLLEEAAVEKKDAVRDLVSNKYSNLKDVFVSPDSNVRQSLENAKVRTSEAVVRAREASEEKVKELATQIDENVHDNPWPYIGGVAVGALLLGYILGRK